LAAIEPRAVLIDTHKGLLRQVGGIFLILKLAEAMMEQPQPVPLHQLAQRGIVAARQVRHLLEIALIWARFSHGSRARGTCERGLAWQDCLPVHPIEITPPFLRWHHAAHLVEMAQHRGMALLTEPGGVAQSQLHFGRHTIMHAQQLLQAGVS
jgi:hypothetical protein